MMRPSSGAAAGVAFPDRQGLHVVVDVVAAVDEADPTTTVTSKRSLLVASHAMERAFDSVSLGVNDADHGRDFGDVGLVIGFFQHREYFDVEAERYAALAAYGHTVVVAFTATVDGVPPGVTAVRLSEDDPRAGDWVLSLVRGSFGANLHARDLHRLSAVEATLEASRLFQSWTSLRRHRTIKSARAYLDGLAADLPASVLAAAYAHLEASAALPVSQVEDRLTEAVDHLLVSLEVGYQRADALRLELQSTRSQAERDQLTGLHNRHFLERYLGLGDRPADLLALLVDVDGLKQVNDTFGHEAGDALLRCVANTLLHNSRPGDVVVRWGGDEFLLLVPHIDAAAGLGHGKRLATAVAGARVETPWENLMPSVSIGVCPTRRTPLPLAALDAALHHVKQNGKGHAALPPSQGLEPVPGA